MESYKKPFQTTLANVDKPIYESYSKAKSKALKGKISMSKKDFVSEHKNLVNILRKGNRAKLKAEARKQAKELNEE